MNTLALLLTDVFLALDPTPAKEDVKAGWGAFGIFLGLAVTVAFLGWSLTRHLKKTKRNAEAGAFGDSSAPDSEES